MFPNYPVTFKVLILLTHGTPGMNERSYGHSSVAVWNKLGSYQGNRGESCEVCDLTHKKLVFPKQSPHSNKFCWKVFVFGFQSQTALYYDVDKDEWCEEKYELKEDLSGYTCTLVAEKEF